MSSRRRGGLALIIVLAALIGTCIRLGILPSPSQPGAPSGTHGVASSQQSPRDPHTASYRRLRGAPTEHGTPSSADTDGLPSEGQVTPDPKIQLPRSNLSAAGDRLAAVIGVIQSQTILGESPDAARRERFQQTLETVAERMGVELIFDQSALGSRGFPIVLYSNRRIDLTPQVSDALGAQAIADLER